MSAGEDKNVSCGPAWGQSIIHQIATQRGIAGKEKAPDGRQGYLPGGSYFLAELITDAEIPLPALSALVGEIRAAVNGSGAGTVTTGFAVVVSWYSVEVLTMRP